VRNPWNFSVKLKKEAPIRKKGKLVKSEQVGASAAYDLTAYTRNQAFFYLSRILGHKLATTVLEIDENDKGALAAWRQL